MHRIGRAGCAALIMCCAGGGLASADDGACPGNPDAIGTGRKIILDPATLPRIGNMQYRTSLPLGDHEVVITFDDGPFPPYTTRVLDILKDNCVKATYFLVGRMALAFPSLVRRIYNDGHTVGTHSQNHPLAFDRIGNDRLEREVDAGIASVKAAIGDPRAVAPFFRFPGLARSKRAEQFLTAQSLAVWSADGVADDWHPGITAATIVTRAVRRIEANRHRGVLLLHDINPTTVRALPPLLRELKARGYRVVQVVPPGERPESVPDLPPTQIAKAADDVSGPPRRHRGHKQARRNQDTFSAAFAGTGRLHQAAAGHLSPAAANY